MDRREILVRTPVISDGVPTVADTPSVSPTDEDAARTEQRLRKLAVERRLRKLAGEPPPSRPQPVKKKAPVGRNQLCPCGSGAKYKRCHGATTVKAYVPPARKRPTPPGVTLPPTPGRPINKPDPQEVARALLQAGMPEQFVFAYLETGVLVTATNRETIAPEKLAAWDKACTDYNNLPEDQRAIYALPQT